MTAQLDALLADAIANDYEEGQERKIGTSRVIAAIISATAVTFMLGVAIVDTRSNASSNNSTKSALVSRIQEISGRVSSLELNVQQANRDLQVAEQAKLAGTSLGSQAGARLDQLRNAAGFTDVTGKGVRVTLDDAPLDGTLPDTVTEPGKVVDGDLQMVINGLWQAGATAISVNGHRLTSSSAVRGAGQAILVDYRPLVRPYEITAIAPNADRLAIRFRENQGGLLLEELEANYGLRWQIQTVGEVTLPAATNSNSSLGDISLTENIGGTP